MQLAIDTSTDITTIALSKEGEVVAELTWHCAQSHTVELIPNIIHLLSHTGAEIQSITGIAVARGPGSFNGLRVGMSTAKGLAFTLDIPLVGISTLEVEAFPHAYTELVLCPIHNAGRGEIAAAFYQLKENRWCRLLEEHITSVDTLCSQIKTRTLLCGELPSWVEAQIKGQLGELVVIPEPVVRLRRAGWLARLGWQRLEKGDFDDPAALQPLYLRKPAITQPKNKIKPFA